MKLTKQQRDNITKIVRQLNDVLETFAWGDTPQGYSYWSDVKKNLERLSEVSYKSPTDEDAKLRPNVEVKDVDDTTWKTRTLLAIHNSKFITVDDIGRPCSWDVCRMEV